MQLNRLIITKRIITQINLNWFTVKSFKMASENEATTRLNSTRKKPLIVICGCTGTGKTKLSIELAQWLISKNRKCEIINADAMQVHYFLFKSILTAFKFHFNF